ncbi:MAG: hypothetical protein HYU66_00045, partial [Armatimonadetes bacterium]|nr:hypothetical protein [Armatimonadota bacterium]
MDELDGSFYYGYDQSSQLTSELRTGDDPFAPLYNYTYTYDGVGNRRVLDKGSEIVESTYNAADELTGTQTFGPAVAGESAFEPFTRAPYSRNAFALNLPLAAGRRYTIEDATLSLVGATGTWDASHRWDLALQSRTA